VVLCLNLKARTNVQHEDAAQCLPPVISIPRKAKVLFFPGCFDFTVLTRASGDAYSSSRASAAFDNCVHSLKKRDIVCRESGILFNTLSSELVP
jgi:hypothetical protein